jgi:transcriptional regulator of acetoin/glycerol metabolism
MSETGSKTGWAAHLVGHGLLRKPQSIELQLMRILRYLYWLSSNSAVDLRQSGRSGFSIQNVEVTFVEKQTASSFSTGLPQDAGASQSGSFPTIAEMTRTVNLAAYQKSNRMPLESARLLGIGETTLYRKVRELGQAAA